MKIPFVIMQMETGPWQEETSYLKLHKWWILKGRDIEDSYSWQ